MVVATTSLTQMPPKPRVSKPRFRSAYQRKMQRIYRKATADERLALRALVVSLEAQATARLQGRKDNTTMLTWRETAVALREEMVAAQSENRKLRAQVRMCRDLIESLRTHFVCR
ncbi:hypothetical protein SDRG_08814 [Saprolegnia diclina VS20]|uniref:Uncharacterized protein n=1 Tax=Saprolegnia diclina (strain VS20) TaxID=1156394 RepID=T0QG41_SAPDV|nr:hypothetical protein SDRG_08814 [Saprolegnia diclina VS20]EQC33711.1 hypothetical protein SDRG_08814 [Saprolegnia diclina VS20]|eukprot:XP_008612934.1 hypothetical protein SDRG_08814 [Saprolegnia diclina VS20]